MSVKITIKNDGPDPVEVSMIFPLRWVTLQAGETHDVILEESDYGYNELKIDHGND